MGSYRLAVMVGDGIGPEVMAEAVRVLEAAAATQPDLQLEFDYLPTGLEAHQRLGSTLPDGTLTALESYAGWLLGPLSTHLYRPDDPTMPNPAPSCAGGSGFTPISARPGPSRGFRPSTRTSTSLSSAKIPRAFTPTGIWLRGAVSLSRPKTWSSRCGF